MTPRARYSHRADRYSDISSRALQSGRHTPPLALPHARARACGYTSGISDNDELYGRRMLQLADEREDRAGIKPESLPVRERARSLAPSKRQSLRSDGRACFPLPPIPRVQRVCRARYHPSVMFFITVTFNYVPAKPFNYLPAGRSSGSFVSLSCSRRAM